VLQITMVALDQDLVNSALKILSQLSHCLDTHRELPTIRLVALSGRRPYSSVEIHLATYPESGVLVRDAGDCKAT